MQRYQTNVRNDTLYIETDGERLEIGSLNDICELVGGETYSIEYGQRQRAMDWVDTDDDGEFTFDVREVLRDMSYDEEFITNVCPVAIDETDENGYPLRTSVFADLMMQIWDSKGNLEGQ